MRCSSIRVHVSLVNGDAARKERVFRSSITLVRLLA
jgi:hypothetical protein